MQTTIAQAIATGIETVRRAWKEKFTDEPSHVTLMSLVAQVAYESLFGRNAQGFGKLEAGTNNYGSYQATRDFRSRYADTPGYGECAYTDSHIDGSKYAAALRLYPNQLTAARDWLSLVLMFVKAHGYNPLSDITPAVIGDSLGYHVGNSSYSETPVDAYAARVQEWYGKVEAVDASGLGPEDPEAVLGDDFPPDAAGRVRIYSALLPDQGGANVAGVTVGGGNAPRPKAPGGPPLGSSSREPWRSVYGPSPEDDSLILHEDEQ